MRSQPRAEGSPQADALRRELVEAAAAAGLAPLPGPEGGPPPARVRRWRNKLGFDREGYLAYALYSRNPHWVPVDRDDLAVAVGDLPPGWGEK